MFIRVWAMDIRQFFKQIDATLLDSSRLGEAGRWPKQSVLGHKHSQLGQMLHNSLYGEPHSLLLLHTMITAKTLLVSAVLFLLTSPFAFGQSASNYSVLVSATAQTNPPKITLSWPTDS